MPIDKPRMRPRARRQTPIRDPDVAKLRRLINEIPDKQEKWSSRSSKPGYFVEIVRETLRRLSGDDTLALLADALTDDEVKSLIEGRMKKERIEDEMESVDKTLNNMEMARVKIESERESSEDGDDKEGDADDDIGEDSPPFEEQEDDDVNNGKDDEMTEAPLQTRSKALKRSLVIPKTLKRRRKVTKKVGEETLSSSAAAMTSEEDPEDEQEEESTYNEDEEMPLKSLKLKTKKSKMLLRRTSNRKRKVTRKGDEESLSSAAAMSSEEDYDEDEQEEESTDNEDEEIPLKSLKLKTKKSNRQTRSSMSLRRTSYRKKKVTKKVDDESSSSSAAVMTSEEDSEVEQEVESTDNQDEEMSLKSLQLKTKKSKRPTRLAMSLRRTSNRQRKVSDNDDFIVSDDEEEGSTDYHEDDGTATESQSSKNEDSFPLKDSSMRRSKRLKQSSRRTSNRRRKMNSSDSAENEDFASNFRGSKRTLGSQSSKVSEQDEDNESDEVEDSPPSPSILDEFKDDNCMIESSENDSMVDQENERHRKANSRKMKKQQPRRLLTPSTSKGIFNCQRRGRKKVSKKLKFDDEANVSGEEDIDDEDILVQTMPSKLRKRKNNSLTEEKMDALEELKRKRKEKERKSVENEDEQQSSMEFVPTKKKCQAISDDSESDENKENDSEEKDGSSSNDDEYESDFVDMSESEYETAEENADSNDGCSYNEDYSTSEDEMREDWKSIISNLNRSSAKFTEGTHKYWKVVEETPKKKKMQDGEDRKFRKANEIYQPLVDGLRPMATDSDLADAEIVAQFEVYQTDIAKDCDGECVCGREDLKYLNFVHNIKVKDIVERSLHHTGIVGSECVNHFYNATGSLMKMFDKMLKGKTMVFEGKKTGYYYFTIFGGVSGIKSAMKRSKRTYILPMRVAKKAREKSSRDNDDSDDGENHGISYETDDGGGDGGVKRFARKNPAKKHEVIRIRVLADDRTQWPRDGLQLVRDEKYLVKLKLNTEEEDNEEKRKIVKFIIFECEKKENVEKNSEGRDFILL